MLDQHSNMDLELECFTLVLTKFYLEEKHHGLLTILNLIICPLNKKVDSEPIDYPKPDGRLTFDKLTNVSFSSTYHEENQPCHLKLTDDSIPISNNFELYDSPEQRYCPAGVYEVLKEMTSQNFKLIHKIAYTVKLVILKIQNKILIGFLQKVGVVQITQICKFSVIFLIVF